MGEELIVTKERPDFAPQSLAYPAEDACRRRAARRRDAQTGAGADL
jgi:hypothetical protein